MSKEIDNLLRQSAGFERRQDDPDEKPLAASPPRDLNGNPYPSYVVDRDVAFGKINGDIFFAAARTTRMPQIITDPTLPDNPIVFANPAFLRLTGYDEHEIIGHNCRFLQGPETSADAVALIRDAITRDEGIDIEIVNYRKDGTPFWNNLYITPVRNEEGKTIFFFASQLDTSYVHEAARALRQANHMEGIGQLTGGIAHDFNNLLQIIIGYGEVLNKAHQTELPENFVFSRSAHNALPKILSAAKRGATLIEQLLSFSRRQRLDAVSTDLNSIVSTMNDLASHAITKGVEGAKIEFVMALEENLWPVNIDRTRMERAILNILINARDAMHQDGRVYVSTSNETFDVRTAQVIGRIGAGRYVSLKIRDTGTGIDPEILPRVNEPFFTTKPLGKGSGLGLAVVHGFVQQSGGGLHITSEKGKGTTISMYFPVTGDIVQHDVIRSDRPTILVVEDENNIASLAKDVLTMAGYHAIVAGDAETALKIIQDGHVDLLFTDILMPGSMNGVVLALRVREVSPDLPVILTTAYSDRLDADLQIKNRFDIISKPYLPDEMVRRINYALHRRKTPSKTPIAKEPVVDLTE